MNKMIGVAWFTNSRGCTGLVITKNESGEEKAFISAVPGDDELNDIKVIMDWGCKVQDVKAAKALVLANGGEIEEEPMTAQDIIAKEA